MSSTPPPSPSSVTPPASPAVSVLRPHPRRSRVVILGGGFAGASIALSLNKTKDIDVTLVDTKYYFEDTTGVLASLVDPKEHSPLELQIPYASFLGQTDVFVGQVIEVTSRHVIVSRFDADDAAATVECIPYNFLVVCTGMRYSLADAHSTGPSTIGCKNRTKSFVTFSEQLRRSTSVAVVGGRLTGVELAGRIAAYFGKMGRRGGEARTVTLFEKEPEILPGFPEQAVAYARKKLEEAGVKIVTSREALFPTDIQHSVTSGALRLSVLNGGDQPSSPSTERRRKWGLGSKSKDADDSKSTTPGGKGAVEEHIFSLIIDCTGGTPNTDFLKDQFGDALDERGFIKVRTTMQVYKHPFMFAAGDVVSMMDERTSAVALQQANVVARNVAVMALMGASSTASLGSVGKLRSSYTPKQDFFIHYVAGMINDKDGFVVESHSFSSANSKVGPMKRKTEANAIKAFGARRSLLLEDSKSAVNLEDSEGSPYMELVSPRYHVGVSKKVFATLNGFDSEASSSPRAFATISAQARQFAQETVIMRFCDSIYGKQIAYAMMKRFIPIHPFVRVDQIHEATALLRDAPLPVTITAEMADRQNFSALLAGAKCVILPVWPSPDDDDAASLLTQECKAVASAVHAAHVPHVILLCPKTRHKYNECLSSASSSSSDLCMSCVFEGCVEAFRSTVRKRLTVLYVEPEMRNPVLMHTLQAIQLNRQAPLPLGEAGNEEHPELYMSFVEPADVIDAILEVYSRPTVYREKEFHLTGTKALTGTKIAHAISRSLREEVKYECVKPEYTFHELIMNRVPRSAAQYLAMFMASTTPEGCRTHDLKNLISRQHKQLSFSQWVKQKRALFLSGTFLDDIDLDDVLKKPEAVRELISSVVSGKRIIHTEINESELVLEESIGQGACAVVYKAQYRGATVAVKQFKASVVEFDPFVFRQEVAIISILRHPDLVSCIGACTHNKESLRIVVEYMPKGSLDTFIRTSEPAGPFSLQRQFIFACDIARAMKFLHGIGMIHGDLKPANLLVTDNLQIKLTDFDTCKFLSPKMKTQLGTPDFIPPESFKEKGYTQMVDVYAYGITLWEIATRKQPYADIDVFDIPERVSGGLRPEAQPSHPLYPMMRNCWQEKPQKRPTFVSILEELEGIATGLGISLHHHSSSSSGGSATSSPGVAGLLSPPSSRKSVSSPLSPLLQSSTRRRGISTGSPPESDSPRRHVQKSPRASSPKENKDDSGSPQKLFSSPPTHVTCTNPSTLGPSAGRKTMKAMREPRLVHRQSSPNMRGVNSNARLVAPSTSDPQGETVPTSSTPDSGSNGTTTPNIGSVGSSSPTAQTESLPTSICASPKAVSTSLESLLSERPLPDANSMSAAGPGTSAQHRARSSRKRFSVSKELSDDASASIPSESPSSGDFLLVSVDHDCGSPAPDCSKRKKHHRKELSSGDASSESNRPVSPRKLRIKPPPVTTPTKTDDASGCPS